MKRRILLSVLLGTLMTTAIAWTQYVLSPRVGKRIAHTVDAQGKLLQSEVVTFEQMARYAGRSDIRFGGNSMFDVDPPNWWPWHGWRCEGYGWPWHGLFNMYKIDENDPRRIPYLATGIPLRGLRHDPNTGERFERALPIVPSPLGLADIAVWSVVAAGGLWLMSRARRASRRRRGLCADCGHSLAGLAVGAACPECGAGRMPTAA